MTLFDEFTGSFAFRLTVEGEEKEMTGSEMLSLLYSPDRELRERAFASFLSHHEKNGLVLTAIFNALILDHRVEDRLRGYQGPMHRTHLENEIPQGDRGPDDGNHREPLSPGSGIFRDQSPPLGLTQVEEYRSLCPFTGKRQKDGL